VFSFLLLKGLLFVLLIRNKCIPVPQLSQTASAQFMMPAHPAAVWRDVHATPAREAAAAGSNGSSTPGGTLCSLCVGLFL
jgi:hypothetical protein